MTILDKIKATLVRGDGDAPTAEIRMSEGYARRKTAYRIDPLLHQTLVIDQSAFHSKRTNGEMTDASPLHKHRRFNRKGNPYWMPLVIIAIALALFVTSVPHKAEAHLGQPAKTTVSASTKADWRTLALNRLSGYGYRWTTDAGASKAIIAWQTVNGLFIDDIVGPQTLGSLGLSKNIDASALPVNPAPDVPAVVSSPAPMSAPTPPPSHPESTEAIIRDVWPDNLEDEAVRIAKRESGPNLKVNAANYCCYGNFQIYFAVHRAWLADYGVNQPSDLFDPRTNATVALALYNTSGWGPWK